VSTAKSISEIEIVPQVGEPLSVETVQVSGVYVLREIQRVLDLEIEGVTEPVSEYFSH